MWQHLEECHVEEYHQVKGSGSERISNKSKEKQQMNIGEACKASQPLSHSSQPWKTLTDSVCYFIAKDLQHYDTINDPGFRQMIDTHLLTARQLPKTIFLSCTTEKRKKLE